MANTTRKKYFTPPHDTAKYIFFIQPPLTPGGTKSAETPPEVHRPHLIFPIKKFHYPPRQHQNETHVVLFKNSRTEGNVMKQNAARQTHEYDSIFPRHGQNRFPDPFHPPRGCGGGVIWKTTQKERQSSPLSARMTRKFQ